MRGYVPIFFDWMECTQDLTLAEKGSLIDAVMLYATGGDYEAALTGNERIAFRFMRGQIDRNNEISEIRTNAASKRSKPEQTEANESKPTAKANKTEQMKAKQSKQEREERFLKFWAAYPKRVAKTAAVKAFEKLKPDDELLDIMLIAIGKQKNSEQWTKDGGQFIPYPATWINERRWEDDWKPQAGPKLQTVRAQEYEQRDYQEEHERPEDMLARLMKEG